MLRDQINYAEFQQRAVPARLARDCASTNMPGNLIGRPAFLRYGLRGRSGLNFMDDNRIDDRAWFANQAQLMTANDVLNKFIFMSKTKWLIPTLFQAP